MKDFMIPVRCTGTTKSQFSALCKAKETTPSEYLRELINKEIDKHNRRLRHESKC
jgi:hypothetical protein